MSQEHVQPSGRNVSDEVRTIIFRKSSKNPRKREPQEKSKERHRAEGWYTIPNMIVIHLIGTMMW